LPSHLTCLPHRGQRTERARLRSVPFTGAIVSADVEGCQHDGPARYAGLPAELWLRDGFALTPGRLAETFPVGSGGRSTGLTTLSCTNSAAILSPGTATQ
jgi:uncharacterized Fe-S cluster-containing radical SAM superfamily protein